MPIYEYQCTKCDTVFEEWCRHIDDHEAPLCPACGGNAKRLISHTSFALKGGGWYATEYGSLKKPEAPKETATAATKEAEPKATTPATAEPSKAEATPTAPSKAAASPTVPSKAPSAPAASS